MTGTFGLGSGWLSGPSGQDGIATVLVQLLDRRTEMVHRVDGRPLAIWVAQGAVSEAVGRLMAGRDPQIWTVRVMEMASGRSAGQIGTTARVAAAGR